MTPVEQQWVGKTLFNSIDKKDDDRFKTPIQLWYYPPEPESEHVKLPDPERYLMRALFLWMPRKKYKFQFKCPNCNKILTSKGLYPKLRLVLNLKSYYYLASEYLGCKCGGTFVSTDSRIMIQLPHYLRAKLPAVLTYMYACDKAVISLLRSRTAGNSSHALKNCLFESHTEEWINKSNEFFAECDRYTQAHRMVGSSETISFKPFPLFRNLPQSRWFLSAYVRDVWSRLDGVRAQITSVFGDILKFDSTKKILRKLAGEARNTASWVTNVSNEYGAVLQCVLTSSESNEALQDMANGLQERYKNANVAPPRVLYIDRDCCSESGTTRYHSLFPAWEGLLVRLDIWHFMKRFSDACTSQTHPLFQIFLRQLSACIFEWDPEDYKELFNAKREELQAEKLDPTDEAVAKAITKAELAHHCRRRTRGVHEAKKCIEDLLLNYTGVTDSLGVPLFKQHEMVETFKRQEKHIACIQDPANISLYTQVGLLKKGNRQLPKFRCARGSTSLEQFHHHITTFIPGQRANAVNFQAYLIDGLARWNTARIDSVEVKSLETLRTFDVELISVYNKGHERTYHRPFNKRQVPNQPTSEAIGVEYLFRQTNQVLDSSDEAIERNVIDDDSGECVEEEFEENDVPIALPGEDQIPGDDQQPLDEATIETFTATDRKSIPGWDKVDLLAQALLKLKGISVLDSEANNVITLYQNLEEYDKKPLTYKAVSNEPVSGSFQQKKRGGHYDVVKMKRAFLGGKARIMKPSKSRITEALCIHLCQRFTAPATKTDDRSRSRWATIVSEYMKVRARLLCSSKVLANTGLELVVINETSLKEWYKDRERRDIETMILQGVPDPPITRRIASESLPPPKEKPTNIHGDAPTFLVHQPEDLSGKANVRKRRGNRNQEVNITIPKQPKPLLPKPPTLPMPAHQPFFFPPHASSQISPPLSPPSFAGQFIVLPPCLPPSASVSTPPTFANSARPPDVPKSTHYKHLKLAKMGKVVNKERRITCQQCGRQTRDGKHRQVFGYKYCPFDPGAVSYEEFKAKATKDHEEMKKKTAKKD